MFILHLALGGCLGLPPIRFGVTADTGGHIAYVIEAAREQALLSEVHRIAVVTRLFEDSHLGVEYSRRSERVDDKTTIERVPTSNRNYLEKSDLALDIPEFANAFCTYLATLDQLPQVIHAHFADAAFVACTARARFGIPFVYTPHSLGIDKQRLMIADIALDQRIEAERNAIAAADAMIVSTHDEAERQVASYGVPNLDIRIRCIPPGVPRLSPPYSPATISDFLAQWLEDTDKPIVLAIARPVLKKNLVALMRAFAATPQLQDRANLVILAGQHGEARMSGEERQVVTELYALAATDPLRGRVALPPRHDASHVSGLYRKAASGGVFVNPALHEPFGLTLIEAAAAGVPVVATMRGGPVDIIAATGHGVLVDPLDEAAIAAACLRVISDTALHLRLSRAASDNARKFSWQRYAQQSLSLYAALRCPPQTAGARTRSQRSGTASATDIRADPVRIFSTGAIDLQPLTGLPPAPAANAIL